MITAPSMWATARELNSLSFSPVAAVDQKFQAAGWPNTGVERVPDGLPCRLIDIASSFSIAWARNSNPFTYRSPQTPFMFGYSNTSNHLQLIYIHVGAHLRRLKSFHGYKSENLLNTQRKSSSSRAMRNKNLQIKSKILENNQ